MNNTIKYLLVCALTFGLFNNACIHNQKIVQVDRIKFYLPTGWTYVKIAADKYEIRKDALKILINLLSDSTFTDTHLMSPEEYIQAEYPNFLTEFAFNKPGVIYTTKENIEKIREQSKHEVKIEENPNPVLERYLKLNDSLLNKEGIDYLCQFQINNEKKWVPVKLPDYYNDFVFEIDTIDNMYRKLYYPINGSTGKIGILIKDFNHHLILSARSSLINDKMSNYNAMLKIFNSLRMI